MANILTSPFFKALDANGNPISGARLYFYYSGSSTPAPIYTTEALNVEHPNPVPALASGEFPAIFMSPIIAYRVRQTDESGALTRPEADPVYGKDPALQSIESIMLNGAVLAQVDDRIYATEGALGVDLSPDDDDLAVVISDPDPAKNDFYRKEGASGTGFWVKLGFNGSIVQQYAVQAFVSAQNAAASASASAGSAAAAATSATNAGNSATAAAGSASAASTSAGNAAASAAAALVSENDAEAAAATAASFADTINLTLAQLIQIQDVLGLPTGYFQPQIYDSFTGDGNLNGRLTPIRSSPWIVDWAPPPATAGNINTFATSGGKMGSTGASQAGRTWASIQGNITGFASLRTGVNGFAGTQFHLSYNSAGAGTAKQQGLSVNSVFSGDNGTTSIAGQSGGVASGSFVTKQAIGCPTYVGDTLTLHTYAGGAGIQDAALYLNGQKIITDFRLSGFDFPITGKHGVGGTVASNAVDAFSLSNPEIDAWLMAYGPARVRQINPDRTTFTGNITAIGAHPPIVALYYDLIDEATGLVVDGQLGLRTTNFLTVSDTEVSGKTQPVTIGTGFYSISMFRHGLVDTNGSLSESRGSTARFKVGDNCAKNGQSNAVRPATITWTTTAPVTQPPLGDSWVLDAVATSTDINSYSRRISANTPLAMAHNTISAATGRATSFIAGGVSGSSISTRGVGSANHEAIRRGIRRAGGAISWQHFADGENDALGGTWSTWQSFFDAIHNDLEALSGMPIKTVISAIGSGWGNSFGANAAQSETNAQAMRRAQWAAAQANPTKYGIYYKSDCQHLTGDGLHFNGDGMAEYERRAAIGFLKMIGLSTHDRSGPKMLSASRSGDTCTVNLDLNGGTGLEMVNTSYASDFGGGVQFSLSSTFGTLLAPTGISFGTAAGGQQTATWTFAGGSVTGPLYVRSHYGRNPFNPTDNATINQDMANRASMLRVQYPSEPSIPVAPYFGTNDYLTAA